MVIERDLQITIDDGLVRRADVYRPKTDTPVSVIMTLAPYRQGREVPGPLRGDLGLVDRRPLIEVPPRIGNPLDREHR
jgi:predicted acyl esterase